MTDFEHDKAYIKDNKIILKEQEGFPEREIGEVREGFEQTIKYFEDRYDLLKEKVDDVQQKIESEDNKGSFLMKVLNLKESLASYDGIGDFTSLSKRLNQLENMLNEYIEQNRKRNTEVKLALLEEAKAYANNPNWKEATEQLKELKQRWIRIGAAAEDKKDAIESEFQSIYTEFFDKKQEFYETKKQMIESRINAYEELVEKAKNLTGENLNQQKQKLIEEWKSLGGIPKEEYDKLVKVFKKLTANPQKGKGKNNRDQRIDTKSIIESKKELLKQAKALTELELSDATAKMKGLQQKWKAAGSTYGKSEAEAQLNQDFFFTGDYYFEKSFLENLFDKKWRGDEAKNDKKAIDFKIKLIKDLLYRDKKELEVFEENLEKFNIGANKIDKMVSSKHNKQKRKIAVKQHILKELNDFSKKIK